MKIIKGKLITAEVAENNESLSSFKCDGFFTADKEVVIIGQEDFKEITNWLNAIYSDTSFFDLNENKFRRFVEKVRGQKSSGIILGGVQF